MGSSILYCSESKTWNGTAPECASLGGKTNYMYILAVYVPVNDLLVTVERDFGTVCAFEC